MENNNSKNKKENNKYVLLEKPMFFNSKLNKEANQTIDKSSNYKDLNTNNIPLSQNNKDNNIKSNEIKPKTENTINNNNNDINDIQKDSPKKEMKFRCFKVDPNETKWCSRYGRPGFVKSSRNEEDEKYLKEHFQNLEKKEAFDFNSMEKNSQIHIFLKNKEILDDNINNKILSFKSIDFHPLLQKRASKRR